MNEHHAIPVPGNYVSCNVMVVPICGYNSSDFSHATAGFLQNIALDPKWLAHHIAPMQAAWTPKVLFCPHKTHFPIDACDLFVSGQTYKVAHPKCCA
jgi:hypothetical protein